MNIHREYTHIFLPTHSFSFMLMSCCVQVQMNTNQPSPVCLGLGDCSLVNNQKQCESDWNKRYHQGPTDMGMNSWAALS